MKRRIASPRFRSVLICFFLFAIPVSAKQKSKTRPFTYVVRSGDTLPIISVKLYGTENLWRALAKTNHLTKSAKLIPGTHLKVATKPTMSARQGYEALKRWRLARLREHETEMAQQAKEAAEPLAKTEVVPEATEEAIPIAEATPKVNREVSSDVEIIEESEPTQSSFFLRLKPTVTSLHLNSVQSENGAQNDEQSNPAPGGQASLFFKFGQNELAFSGGARLLKFGQPANVALSNPSVTQLEFTTSFMFFPSDSIPLYFSPQVGYSQQVYSRPDIIGSSQLDEFWRPFGGLEVGYHFLHLDKYTFIGNAGAFYYLTQTYPNNTISNELAFRGALQIQRSFGSLLGRAEVYYLTKNATTSFTKQHSSEFGLNLSVDFGLL